MAQVKRADRVADLLRRGISQILLSECRDPELGFVTLTRVTLSDDLKFARVYFSLLGDEETKEKSFEALQRISKYVRRRIGQELKLRFTPELTFCRDDSLEHVYRIEEVLKQIHDQEQPPTDQVEA